MLSFPWYWQKGFPASGLFLTYLGLYLMDGHGQPALLYLVPCTLGNKLCYLALGRLHSFWFANRKEFFLFYSRKFFFPWSIKYLYVLDCYHPSLWLCYQVLLLYWVWWEVSWSTCGIMVRSCHRHHHQLGIFLEKLEALDQSLSSRMRWTKIALISLKCSVKRLNSMFLHSIRILTQYDVKITVKAVWGLHISKQFISGISHVYHLFFLYLLSQ